MKFLPYARLLRLPNVFTAFADILLGTLAAKSWAERPANCVALLAASGCLYLAGMVWNDYFDLAEDRRDRPFRPLPSGQVSLSAARWLGTGLLIVGFFCAALAGLSPKSWSVWPTVVAALLIAAILLYDGGAKRTVAGPIIMGSCRLLNVLLALSIAPVAEMPWIARWHLAAIVGVYIVGVTWFARQEAGRSDPLQLKAAAAVITTALVLAVALPLHRSPGQVTVAYPYLLAAFIFLIAPPIVRATAKPEAANVQSAVKRCILGLIVLDAILAIPFAGWWGLLILLLLPPSLLLGKYLYST